MKYINNENFNLKNTVVSIGIFDGIHQGHQKLILQNKKSAIENNLSSVALTFSPHPRTVIFDENIPSILTSLEKRRIFSEFSLDYFIEYPFNMEFSKLNPDDFFDTIIIKKLGCKIIVVGEGYRFGAKQRGDIKYLKKLCDNAGIILETAAHVNDGDVKISSSSIRKLIAKSDFETAERYLTRPYFITGVVLKGKQLGNTIGFPTANLILPQNKLLPTNGVFATKVIIDGKEYIGATNVGNNPTVDGKFITVETFVINFNEEIYDKEIKVLFNKKIREEMKFPSLDELKKQINNDVSDIKTYFGRSC